MIRVYEVKRHCFSLYMALCIPLPSMAVNLPCLTGSLSQLPSFGISIIRRTFICCHLLLPLQGTFRLNLLITSLSWLESGVRGGTVPRHFVPLIADSNHDTLTMRFSCYAACSICFCGLLMSLIIFAPS